MGSNLALFHQMGVRKFVLYICFETQSHFNVKSTPGVQTNDDIAVLGSLFFVVKGVMVLLGICE